MSNFFDLMKEVNDFTLTENGAGAYKSTGDAVLDAYHEKLEGDEEEDEEEEPKSGKKTSRRR